MERAKILFGCYRRGDANDPDQYVASIAAVLTLYEPPLIREVTDPRTGISTSTDFCDYMPNSGQLKLYCDAIRDRRARYDYLGSLPRAPVPRRLVDHSEGRRANVFVHADAPQYARAVELSKTADSADWKHDPAGRAGIWIAHNVLYGVRPLGDFKTLPAPTDDELRAHYKPRVPAE